MKCKEVELGCSFDVKELQEQLLVYVPIIIGRFVFLEGG